MGVAGCQKRKIFQKITCRSKINDNIAAKKRELNKLKCSTELVLIEN